MDLGTVLFIHGRIANAAWLYMVILAVWNIANYVRGRGLDGNMMGAIVVGVLLMLTQASLGVTMWLGFGFPPFSLVHVLYGGLAVLSLPAIWVYTRGATDRRASLIWAIAGLFMFGLILRAIGTAT
jgi:hypothetical protein